MLNSLLSVEKVSQPNLGLYLVFLAIHINDACSCTVHRSPNKIQTFYNTEFAVVLSTDQPEFTAHSQNVTKPEGDNVSLSCNATGNPVPTISWLINGSPMNTTFNNSRMGFSGNQKHLTISNLRRTDSGKYRCKAINSLGNATYDVATLDVQCK